MSEDSLTKTAPTESQPDGSDDAAVGSAPDGPSRAPSTFWTSVGRGFATAARATGRAAVGAASTIGQKAREGYRAIDPDVRRHIAETPLLGLGFFGTETDPCKPQEADGHPPLILVHGLGGAPGNFALLKAWLNVHGRSRVYALSLGPEPSFDAMADAVVRYVESVVSSCGLGPTDTVDVVAHSMGGIVMRVALERESFSARVRTLVTLGTPHEGTHLARFLDTELGRGLRPASELLTRLGKQLPWKARPEGGLPRLISFHSHADMVLLSASAAWVEGADNREMMRVTHYGYLLDPRAFAQVDHALVGAASLASGER